MPRRTLPQFFRLIVALIILSLALPGVAFGQEGDPAAPAPAVGAAPQQPAISYHAETGKVRFMAAETGKSLAQAPGFTHGFDAGSTPELAARYFLGEYAAQFGIQDPQRELTLERVRPLESGASAVRFQQVYQGVPILGGELIVQVNQAGQTLAAMGEALPDLDLSVEPAVPAAEAAEAARLVAAKAHAFDASLALASAPELWIYNPALLGGPGRKENRLVWRTNVTHPQRLDVRQLVLVDAQTGAVLLHFNQVHAALHREIYTKNNVVDDALPGALVRSEGQAAIGDLDVDNAYDYAGATYNFYLNTHKRDSIDNKGMSLVQTVKYCEPGYTCPYGNAFWNGAQMVYGAGYASGDDVVAHELTHGVTEHESGLFYYMQSGAINEALSDIWGELVDLSYTNGHDNDTPAVRWLMGEDLPIGAIRSMNNPPAYDQPDSTASSNYTCNINDDDGGGVHTNSGVANKAAFLMVDGGTFNGYSITGLGVQKTARIFYSVQTGALTTGSDYPDLHDALAFACTAQIGSNGITAADCDNVRKAIKAVGMDKPADCTATTHAPLCDVSAFNNTFSANLEGWSAVNGNWAASGGSAVVDGVANSYVSMARSSLYSDYTFTAQMQRQGCAACASGLLVRGQTTPLASGNRWNEGYFLAYNPNGQYKVEHWTPAGVVTLQPWTSRTQNIYTGASTNTLSVRSESGALSFYMNGVLLWTGYDYKLRSAQVGIAMISDASAGNRLYVPSTSLAGGTPRNLFIDSFEDGMGRWTAADLNTSDAYDDAWMIDPWGYGYIGTKSLFGYDYSHISDIAVSLGPLALPASGPVFMRFNHYFAFEPGFDGGVVEYSANNGAWTDADALFVNRGYSGTISASYSNPIGGREAFTGITYGFTSSRLNLNPLLGKSVRLRFRAASDTSSRYDGWNIDDVQIYTCDAANYTQFVQLPLLTR